MDPNWTAASVRDIRDPIYGYLRLNAGEARIVESPYFQRLRYVKQNSTAYLTYPSATGTRFEHSLGVAELAGRAVEAVLDRSPPKLRNELIRRCFNEMGHPRPTTPGEARSLVRAMVRVAALLHDIGHLPFSHTFEAVVHRHISVILHGNELRDYVAPPSGAETKAYHERASYRIAEENGFSGRNALFGAGPNDTLVSRGAMRVLRPAPGDVAFRALHDLVDSDIDADRGEYLVRDGTLSGTEFGRYDQERLFSSMRVCRHRGALVIRPGLPALSAVETLFQERVRLYKYLYFHNYVMFTDELLAALMDWLLSPTSANDLPMEVPLDGLRTFLRTFPRERFSYASYVHGSAYTDDAFVWEQLRQALALLDEAAAQDVVYGAPTGSPGIAELRRAHSALRALLNREKLGGSLWKQLPQWDMTHRELEQHDVRGRVLETLTASLMKTGAFWQRSEAQNTAEHHRESPKV